MYTIEKNAEKTSKDGAQKKAIAAPLMRVPHAETSFSSFSIRMAVEMVREFLSPRPVRELRDPGRKLWVLLGGSIEAIDANDPLEIDERPEVPRAEFRLPLRLSRLALAGSSSGVLRLTSGVLRLTSGVLRFILCGRNHAWTLRRQRSPRA